MVRITGDKCGCVNQFRGRKVANLTGRNIFGNATALPPELAAQVITSTRGLPVPPAPEMIGVSEEPLE